jgi:hypothetical protein
VQVATRVESAWRERRFRVYKEAPGFRNGPMLNAPGIQCSNLEYDKLLSSFAFNCNLCRYIEACAPKLATDAAGVACYDGVGPGLSLLSHLSCLVSRLGSPLSSLLSPLSSLLSDL